MKLFRWIEKYIKSIFGVKEKASDTSSTRGSGVSQLPKLKAKRPKKVDYISKQIDDFPEENQIEHNTIYVVGENGFFWLAAFICPCGCGDIIQLNLLADAKPCWRISYKKGNVISISPSIERKFGCRSHFNLTNGKIVYWGNNTSL